MERNLYHGDCSFAIYMSTAIDDRSPGDLVSSALLRAFLFVRNSFLVSLFGFGLLLYGVCLFVLDGVVAGIVGIWATTAIVGSIVGYVAFWILRQL